MKLRYIFILIMSLCCLEMSAQTPLDSAATAYEKGDYNKAISLYEQTAEKYGVSAALLSNLGNAYVKAGDYGKAMLCYERSLRLDPSDSEVKENIAYISGKIDDNNKADAKNKKVSVVPESQSFFSNVREFIVHTHKSDTWAIWAGVMFVLTCVFLALYIFRQEVLLRKIGFFGAIVTSCLCIVTLIFAFMGARALDRHDRGVVTAYKVTLMSEPYATAKANANPLNRGTRLDILDTDSESEDNGKWYKVRLNSDYIGWVRATDFEPI